MEETILLTGTIDPSFFYIDKRLNPINIVLNDTSQRLRQYEDAIQYYITNTPFSKIVFAENSGYSFQEKKYEALAHEHGKKFEYIRRHLSSEEIHLMQIKGKSYGEADLIDYAMKKSILIKQSDYIYKVTGRVSLRNPWQILSEGGGTRFVIKNKIGWCNTEFFEINKKDYFHYFSNSSLLMDDYNAMNIERVWYQIIHDSKIDVRCFRRFPRLHGIIGSTNGKAYDKKWWEYVICDLLCIIGYFNIKR